MNLDPDDKKRAEDLTDAFIEFLKTLPSDGDRMDVMNQIAEHVCSLCGFVTELYGCYCPDHYDE